MLFKPVFRHNLRIAALLAALLICALPLTSVHGQDAIKLKITVKVEGPDGRPVVGAKVVIPRDGEVSPKGESLQPLEGNTDAYGFFVTFSREQTFKYFQLFRDREHKVIVTPPGNLPVFEKTLTNQELSDAAARGGPHEVKISLPANLAKTRVALSGFVRDEQGRPLHGAQLLLAGEASSADKALGETTKVSTNKDGSFYIATEVRLEEKPHQLLVSALGFNPEQREIKDYEFSQAGNSPLAIQFKLTKADGGSSILGYLVVLLLGAALGFGGPRLYRRFWPKRRVVRQSSTAVDLQNISAEVLAIKNNMLTRVAFQQEMKFALKQAWAELGSPSSFGNETGAVTETSRSRTTPSESSIQFNELDWDNDRDQFPGRHSVSQDPETMAFTAYRNLVNKFPISREPIYLDVESPRSAAGKLEDSNVYLSQVGSSRGALVLFSDGGNVGWVFPNPKVAFRLVAIKDVFPDLTELDYERSKENIGPKPVKKLDEGRWLVIRN